MSKRAHIVAISRASLESEGGMGFGITAFEPSIDFALDCGEVWVGPRPVLEEDENFLQPIPYIVVRRGNQLLAYTRSSKGGEDRLHAKVSVGFGGHVDAADLVVNGDGIIDLRATLLDACSREIDEELGILLSSDTLSAVMKFTHLIQSDANAVDRVHIGFVGVLDLNSLPEGKALKFEDTIENAEFLTLSELGDGTRNLESWTALLVDRLSLGCAA
jgi:predicted NUDIX family phosphoesterase